MITYLLGIATGLFGPALLRRFSGPVTRRLGRLVRSYLSPGPRY